MDIILKDYPVTGGKATDEYPNGEFEVILSAPTFDRDGEFVDSKAFDPLPDHITFDTDHSMTCDSVVGSGVPFYDDEGLLKVKGTFASDERSQVIRQKVADGHIRTTSVAFMAADREKDDKGVDHVVKAELLNGTFTPVPANRESLVLTAKSIVAHEIASKVGARNNKTDAEHIQAMHDSATYLGADCAVKSAARASAETKAIVGSDEAQRDRVQRALNAVYPGPDQWVYVRGMFDDHVVFDVWKTDGETDTFQQTFTDDGDIATLTGTPGDVDVVEVVTPDVDSTDSEAAAPAADPAAKAAGSATDAAADEAEQRTALAAAIENVRLATFGR